MGNSTDFEGNFLIESSRRTDSLQVIYMGYLTQTKVLGPENEQTINFQLRPSDIQLDAIVFESGENPAFEIIREAVARKKQFDKRNLTAYETKNYTKIEIDIDNVSKAFTQRKSIQKVTAVLDSIKQLTNDEGEKILPVFFSETHFCENKDTEDIIKAIQEEFELKSCYAGKCWWYSTNQADFRPVAKRIGMTFNWGACSEDCVPDKYKEKSNDQVFEP